MKQLWLEKKSSQISIYCNVVLITLLLTILVVFKKFRLTRINDTAFLLGHEYYSTQKIKALSCAKKKG